VVTLTFVAAFGDDVGLLLGGFHAFGDHLHAQALAQLDDGANDGRIVVVIQQVLNEALVDLDLVQRQAFQVTQR
jgi:BMFP domain-containing protein YqiC